MHFQKLRGKLLQIGVVLVYSFCSLCSGKSDRDVDYRWPLFLTINGIVNESNNELTISPSFHLCYQRDSQRYKILRRHFKSPILIAVICNLCVGAVVSSRAVTLLPGATFSCDCSSEGSQKQHRPGAIWACKSPLKSR